MGRVGSWKVLCHRMGAECCSLLNIQDRDEDALPGHQKLRERHSERLEFHTHTIPERLASPLPQNKSRKLGLYACTRVRQLYSASSKPYASPLRGSRNPATVSNISANHNPIIAVTPQRPATKKATLYTKFSAFCLSRDF